MKFTTENSEFLHRDIHRVNSTIFETLWNSIIYLRVSRRLYCGYGLGGDEPLKLRNRIANPVYTGVKKELVTRYRSAQTRAREGINIFIH